MTPDQEIAALKARLVEAEKALAFAQRGLKCRQEAEAQAHRVYHEAMDKLPVEAKYLHDPSAEPADMMERMVARAEAAERELAGYKHMLSMAHEQRDINRDRAEQSERKCAELSEALRFYTRDTMAVGFSETTVRKCCETKPKEDHESDCRAMLALASQPAPEESK
jgi:hypothetical protein